VKTLLRSLVVLLAVALVVPAAASARTKKTHKPACYKQTPSVLAFTRDVGNPKGMLTWRQPRKKVRVHGRGYTYKQFKAPAFRVYRNGAVVGQTRKTWMGVAVKAGQSYQFRVRVINKHGKQSGCKGAKMSKTVPLLGPGQPASLASSGNSPTSLTLNWQQGPRGDGVLVGYRVYRDGVTVGQTSGTSMQIKNLYSNRDYTFTVQALDKAGRMSPPSLPLLTSTTPPVQTTGHAEAFLLASTDQSFRDLQAHYMNVGTVLPTNFDCSVSGQIVGKDDPLVTTWAKRRGVRVMPRLNCQNPATQHKIFTDEPTRNATLDGMIALVQQYGYDGINLDFEGGFATDRDVYSDFVRDAAARLHAIGRRVSVAVSPKTQDNDPNHPRGNTFDYAALTQYADEVFLMMWGVHWTSSWPGPLADYAFTKQTMDYADATVADRSKWVLGAPMYGLDWPAGGGIDHKATPREYAELMSLAGQFGAGPQWDPVTQESHFNYTDSGGVGHEVWFETAQAIGGRIDLAKQHGFGGVGLWHLGSEDGAIWSLRQLQPGGY
jgi:spore germination protein YaaH